MEELSKTLLEIIGKKEKETTEFKKAEYNLPDNLFESICAMLNRKVGQLDNDSKEVLPKSIRKNCLIFREYTV